MVTVRLCCGGREPLVIRQIGQPSAGTVYFIHLTAVYVLLVAAAVPPQIVPGAVTKYLYIYCWGG